MINPDEHIIEGNWVSTKSGFKMDENSTRIEHLISSYLKKIKTDESGWDTLYQNPEDQSYWKLLHPTSHMHGGGPKTLKRISVTEAKELFKLD